MSGKKDKATFVQTHCRGWERVLQQCGPSLAWKFGRQIKLNCCKPGWAGIRMAPSMTGQIQHLNVIDAGLFDYMRLHAMPSLQFDYFSGLTVDHIKVRSICELN